MNNTRNRKYARSAKKSTASNVENGDTDFSLSTNAAIGILAGVFVVGVAAGALIDMCRK